MNTDVLSPKPLHREHQKMVGGPCAESLRGVVSLAGGAGVATALGSLLQPYSYRKRSTMDLHLVKPVLAFEI